MGADLYGTLGVDRSASAEEIARAGRRKARQVHPDKGGSETEWHALVLAREVLGDPVSRARYDETGEIPQRGLSIEDEARAILMAGFSEMVSKGALGRRMDVADHLRGAMGRVRRRCKEAAREHEALAARLSAQLGRLTGAEAVFFEGYLKEQIAGAERAMAQERRGAEIAAKAVELIADLKDLHAASQDEGTTFGMEEAMRGGNPFKFTW